MIDWTKAIEAVAVGAVDKYLQDMDADGGRTESFKTWSDYFRIAGAVGGLAIAQFMPRYAKIADGIAYPALAFLTQSVWRYAEGTSARGPSRVSYTPVRSGSPAAQRYPAPAQQGEFKTVRIS